MTREAAAKVEAKLAEVGAVEVKEAVATVAAVTAAAAAAGTRCKPQGTRTLHPHQDSCAHRPGLRDWRQ